MSVLRDVLKEEHDRLRSLIKLYQKDIKKLPKGTVVIKSIRGHKYAYRAFRKKEKVLFEYLGPVSSKSAGEVMEKIKERKKSEELMKKARRNLGEVERMLRVRAA